MDDLFDSIVNFAVVSDRIADGEDLHLIEGTDDSDRLRGTRGDDIIFGLGGSDIIRGQGGDDVIVSGAGWFDRVWGGRGSDTFEFGNETSNGRFEFEIINDYRIGADAIDLGDAEVEWSFSFWQTTILVLSGGDHDTVAVRGVRSIDDISFVDGTLNQAPSAADDNGFETPADAALSIPVADLLINDTDPDGDPLNLTSVGNAVGGTVSLETNGTADPGDDVVVFTPDREFSGEASFIYDISDGEFSASAGVTLSVTPVNRAPVATDDDGFETPADTALSIPVADLLINDTDPDGDPLNLTSVGNAVGGTVSLETNGTADPGDDVVVFTPDREFSGEASFIYDISDGEFSASAGVTLSVTPVNRAPVATDDDGFETPADTALSIPVADLLINDTDPDGDPLNLTSVGNAVGGTVSLETNGTADPGDDVVVFTPDREFSGEASFTYDISDGEFSASAGVTLSVTPVNRAPVATDDDGFETPADTALSIPVADLLINDTDPDGDPLNLTSVGNAVGGTVSLETNGTADPGDDVVVFTPDREFSGEASFTYDISDGEFSASAGVTLSVTPVNRAPVATDDDGFETPADTALSIPVADLLINDTDPDGDPLNLTSVGNAVGGTVSLETNGTADPGDDVVVFTPDREFSGEASFTYDISDGEFSASAGVTLEVSADEVASFSVFPGGRIQIALAEFFPGLNSPSFSISSDSELPTGKLGADGVVAFSPTPDDIGIFQFDVTATDAETSVAKSFELLVERDAIPTTRVSGVILNTNGEPLPGIVIQLDGDETTTDAEGHFTISASDAITDPTLKILAGDSEGSPYPSIAEPLKLLLNRTDVFDGFDNVIERPIYLPELDLANAVTVDPAVTTRVTTDNIPGAELVVAAGTLVDASGDPFTGQLSITEVPRELTPASLPRNLLPDIVVTIQPGEMQFLEPAALSLPNRAGYAPGTEMDLWSIDPINGEFAIVGKTRVSADGAIIETIEGGITSSSWHTPVPPPPTPQNADDKPNNPPPDSPPESPGGGDDGSEDDDDGLGDECEVAGTSTVQLHSGAVVERHTTATYQSNGESRGVTLVYDSLRADPSHIIHFGYNDVPDDETLRLAGSITIFDRDFGFTPGTGDPDSGLQDDLNFWRIPPGGGNVEAALQASTDSLQSGRYAYELTTGLLNYDGARVTGATFSQSGTLTVVNSIDSPFGSGWGISGLQEIFESPDGSVLIVDGNGSERLFTANEDGSYTATSGDYSTLEKSSDGHFTRTLPNQTRYEFDEDNRLASVTDRNDQQTLYQYDDEEMLTSIVDEAGLATNLFYQNGKLSSIVDPAGRVTEFSVNNFGNLVEITDTDGSTRGWDYDVEHRIVSETDKRGNIEMTVYDFAGRAQSSTLKDGSTIKYDPIQVQGLFNDSEISDPNAPPFAVGTTEELTSVYTAANGREYEYTLDGRGQITSTSDEIGLVARYERNEDGLVSRSIDGEGNATSYGYDTTGNVTSILEPIPERALIDGEALIVTNIESAEFTNLSALLDDLGLDITISLAKPEDLSTDLLKEFEFIFDLRGSDSTALSDRPDDLINEFGEMEFDANGNPINFDEDDMDKYETFLQNGGTLFIAGDVNTDVRNDSVLTFLNERIDAGGVEFFEDSFEPTDPFNPFATRIGTVNPSFTSPNLLSDERVLIRGAKVLQNVDASSQIITFSDGGVPISKYNYPEDGAGSIIASFDFEIFELNSIDSEDEKALFRNLIAPISGKQIYTYDPNFNRLASYTDELGRQTLYEIDPLSGNTLSVTRVVGEFGGGDDVVTSFTYTADGMVDTVMDPLGRVSDFDYTATGLVSEITFAQGTADQAMQGFEYDLAGNLSSFQDELGNLTTYSYDPMGRIIEIVSADPDGASGPQSSSETTFSYDENGNLLLITDANGSDTQNTYDERNRLINTTDANGGEIQYSYDEVGNLVNFVDANGNAQSIDYDSRDRAIRRIDGRGGETVFEYDIRDNLTAIIDASENRTAFQYDARDRLIKETDALGAETNYSHDIVDNIVSIENRNGWKLNYIYDDLDRLVSERIDRLTARGASAKPHETVYEYDNASNLTGLRDPFGQLSFDYDTRDRITSVTSLSAPVMPEVILDYSYDAVGNRASMVETIAGVEGAATGYQYDALNRMIQIQQSGTQTTDKRVDFTYNALGQFTSISRFSDLTGTQGVSQTTQSYDALNRITGISHTNTTGTFSFYDLEYDVGNRITAISDQNGRSDYNYDATDQIVGAAHENAALEDESYEYDLNGNRVATATEGTDYETGPGNRLLQDSSFLYAYDDEGNLILRTDKTTNETRNFTWDHKNRLVEILDKAADGSDLMYTEYIYDALDRRISKTVDQAPSDAVAGNSLHFVYDGDDVVLEFNETPENPTEFTRRNLHGPAVDQILAIETTQIEQTRWLHADHLRTIKSVTSDSGDIVNEIDYDSFGNIAQQSNPVESVRYAFTGREFDQETGDYYYRARYYDPNSGRFLSEDTFSPLVFSNAFTYVGGNPLNFRDPTGNFEVTIGVRAEVATPLGGLGGEAGIILDGDRMRDSGLYGAGMFNWGIKANFSLDITVFLGEAEGTAGSVSAAKGLVGGEVGIGSDGWFFFGAGIGAGAGVEGSIIRTSSISLDDIFEFIFGEDASGRGTGFNEPSVEPICGRNICC